jgi:type IV pilus assembly protein PilM
MELLPTSLGTRPRLAVEIRPEGVVAARAEDAQALMSAVAHGVFAEGTLAPGLKAGNLVARSAVIASVKKALEAVALKERQVTVVVPDAAVRVLLLDFDSLPAKTVEALPIVRFRLKKLLPFDADDAMVSYQVMSTTRGMVRVLAVAVPKDVLHEYEGVIREAGFEPGAVMPSTLAALAGMPEAETASLVVNAGETAVTTAIVRGGVLLLHRTVDLAAEGVQEAPAVAPVVLEVPTELLALPLVDVDSSASEWARQEPVNGYGVLDDHHIDLANQDEADRLANLIAAEAMAEVALETVVVMTGLQVEEARLAAAAREVTQAVSVAAAYFEDTLESSPGTVMAAGTMGADVLAQLLHAAGFGTDEIRVKETVDAGMLVGGAVSTRVPPGWMAGVRGALRS